MNERSWEVYTQVLSKENLKLTYSNYAKTAYFNLETREVVIPTFDYMSDEVTQLLISHEVGHALHSNYSTKDFNLYTERYGGLFNVVEDAHIENNLKKSFGGLSSIFKEGYKVLHKENFFELEEDLSKYNLTTRLNLFYKLGHILDVPFDGEENGFAVELRRVSTKEDVISLCERILNFISKEDEENKDTSEDDVSNFNTSSCETEDADEDISSNLVEQECPSNERKERKEDNTITFSSDESEEMEELKDEVSSIFEKNILEYGDKMLDEKKNTFFSREILSFSSKECFKNCYNLTNDYSSIKQRTFYTSKACRTLTKQVKELAKSADVVFQQKKKAEELKTTKNVIVGRLDRTKLSKHTICDNIFKKSKIHKEGKNHGVVILVDYSSSMRSVIKDTLIQACVLGEFCRMNDIPFSIVAFGIVAPRRANTMLTALLGHSESFDIGCILALMKDVSYRMAYTPTAEALGVATHIVDAFHKAGVEKSSVFLITDGFYTNSYIKKGMIETFNTKSPHLSIDNVFYSIENIIPYERRVHNDWIIELLLLNLKKRYNSFVSVSYISNYQSVVDSLHVETLINFGLLDETTRRIYDRMYENYLYLWKHKNYFDVSTKKPIIMKNGVLSFSFKENPFLDLFQLFDYNSINESEENILVKDGYYNKRLKILVNEFIERFAQCYI